jgi:hypothetical protein
VIRFASNSAIVVALLTGIGECCAVQVEIVQIDGPVHTGELESWDEATGIKLRTEVGETILSAHQIWRVVPLESRGREPAESGAGAILCFVDGQRIRGQLSAFDGKSARMDCERFGRISVGAELLRGAWWFDPGSIGSVTAREQFEALLQAEADDSDVLFLIEDGAPKPIRGILESLDETGGEFLYRGEKFPFRRDRAGGVVLAITGTHVRASSCRVRLRDGDLLAGEILTANAETLTLKSSLGPEVLLSWSDVAEVNRHNDDVVYLSELEPTSYQFEPLLNTKWNWLGDRSVAGGPIRLDGREYEHGIGVHSQCRLTFALNGHYETFAARVGIDDSVRPRGNVIFSLAADGAVVWTSGPISGRDASRAMSLPVNGFESLSLIVEYGDDLDISDHADWADARLIRK